jgi:transcription elongation factor GreA
MPQEAIYLTEEGTAKLQTELDHLRNVRRSEVAARIQRAKDLESTVNNAEYDDAKNEQAFIEGRILHLETTFKNATVVHTELHASKVEIGCTVIVSTPDGGTDTYTIVGSEEADAVHGRISYGSPVGKALLGRRIGDDVRVSTPAGVTKLKIKKIN